MNPLKIGARLGLGFGSLMLLLAAVAALGLGRLSTIQGELEQFADQRYPEFRAIEELSYQVMDQARIVRNLILLDDPERRHGNQEERARGATTIEERLHLLESRLTDEKGRALLAAIRSARAAFVPLMNDVIALADKGRRAEATALLYGERLEAQGALLKALADLREHQERRIDEAAGDARSVYRETQLAVLALTALALLAGLGCAVFITRSVTKPLHQAMEAAGRIAGGDLAKPIEAGRGDETGLLLAALARMQEALREVVGTVRGNSDQVATASAQIAEGNKDLSDRTESQASALQQTAASMEQLNSTVRQNAENARQANRLAADAAAVAAEGGEVVGQVVSTMKGINDGSRRIADIIGVIDAIAFQTNILALNAAVEAARAGSQGRGFAVVATEVRNLAQRCTEAAREIKGLITESVEQVAQGTALVDRAGATMGEIVGSINRVSEIVSEIASASAEQTSGVSQIGEAVGQMDRATQQNAALVEESAAAADSLRQQAQQLVRAVAVFRTA